MEGKKFISTKSAPKKTFASNSVSEQKPEKPEQKPEQKSEKPEKEEDNDEEEVGAIAAGMVCTCAGEKAVAAGIYCIAIGDGARAIGEYQVVMTKKITFPSSFNKEQAENIIMELEEKKKTYRAIKTPHYFSSRSVTALNYLIIALKKQYELE